MMKWVIGEMKIRKDKLERLYMFVGKNNKNTS